MKGPFVDRDGNEIDGARLEVLYKIREYVEVKKTKIEELETTVLTRWIGHDDTTTPPQIFTTSMHGIGLSVRIHSVTEAEAVAVHDSLVARTRAQIALEADGGSPLLSGGVL